jgi:negative regulator of flagellin synthesis FlgM
MPPIEVGAPRAIDAVSAQPARPRTGAAPASAVPVQAKAQASAPAVQTSTAAGEAPVDTDRVEVIRKAVESGTYPVIPTRIADAMIAAGVLLRTAK